MLLFFFIFVKFCRSIQHCEFACDRKNVKFEWPINYRINIAKVANLLGPGTQVSAVNSNNSVAGTL